MNTAAAASMIAHFLSPENYPHAFLTSPLNLAKSSHRCDPQCNFYFSFSWCEGLSVCLFVGSTADLVCTLASRIMRKIHALESHRITELLMLEKTSNIFKSNHQPISPCPMTTSLSATSIRFLNTSMDGDSTTALGQPVPTLHHSFGDFFFFPNIQPKHPWHNLRPPPFALAQILSTVTREMP